MRILIKKWSIINFKGLIMLFFTFTVVVQGTIAEGYDRSSYLSKSFTDESKNKPLTESNMDMDYDIIPLPILIEQSELIVSGNVKEVKDSTFIFVLDETIKGTSDHSEIEVVKFIPRRFNGPRKAPYLEGQSFILFISKVDDWAKNKIWRIQGIAGEGEVPVERGYVFFKAWNIAESAYKHYQVHGTPRWIQRYSKTTFKNAVGSYSNCFKWEYVESNWVPEQTCADVRLHKYCSQSVIHKYLVRATMKKLP